MVLREHPSLPFVVLDPGWTCVVRPHQVVLFPRQPQVVPLQVDSQVQFLPYVHRRPRWCGRGQGRGWGVRRTRPTCSCAGLGALSARPTSRRTMTPRDFTPSLAVRGRGPGSLAETVPTRHPDPLRTHTDPWPHLHTRPESQSGCRCSGFNFYQNGNTLQWCCLPRWQPVVSRSMSHNTPDPILPVRLPSHPPGDGRVRGLNPSSSPCRANADWCGTRPVSWGVDFESPRLGKDRNYSGDRCCVP